MKKVLFMAALIGLMGCQKEELTEKKGTVQSVAPCPCKPYRNYVATLFYDGSGSVTVIELENDLGDIVWTNEGTCDYYGTLEGAFPIGKTFIYWQNGINVQAAPYDVNHSVDFVRIHNDACEYEYGLTWRNIEIRVY